MNRMSDHGYGTYSNGCRCEVCKKAKADYMRERRAKARARAQKQTKDGWRYVAPIDSHGTRFGYEEHGCRCEHCTRARSDSDNARQQRKRARAGGVA